MQRRQPIEQLLARPDTEPGLKRRLARALDARRFAVQALGLPDNGSYTAYADLGRPYAVWNVFAAPELSLSPYEWCYPVAGCLAYRGFYSLEDARLEAERLRAQGLDVHVAGVPAYSTLGWFDDPVLNTIAASEEQLVATLFHELAHQQAFVSGDTAFNESLASFIEDEGLRQYLAGAPELAAAAEARQRRQERYLELMLAARRRLEALYGSGLPDPELRAGKEAEFRALRQALEGLAREEGLASTAWDGELNNARLLPYGLYHEWVPSFAALFAQVGGDWKRFHAAVRSLARAPEPERRRRLEALRASG